MQPKHTRVEHVLTQVLAVAIGAVGGTAAYAGGSLLSALQKEF